MRIAVLESLGLLNPLLHVPDAPFFGALPRRGIAVAETAARH
ncbi:MULTISPECIES: hypothetical protein [unclassified Mesorhizobium]|nr:MULTISPECIES: hypothetical protein [unclassified Mesorhizobium]